METHNTRLTPKAVVLFAINKITLQHVLYIMAFLTFGIGDGITAAWMMESEGPYMEANPIIRDLFITLGPGGMVAVKIWVTFMMLLATQVLQIRSRENIYWTINGFLIAHIGAGLIGIKANLSATGNGVYTDGSNLVFAYLALVLILTELGSFIDKYISRKN